MIEPRRRAQLLKKILAVVALLGSLAVIVAVVGSVWLQLIGGRAEDPGQPPGTSTPATPAPNIVPLPVRPVQEVRSPDECPPAQGPPAVFPPSTVVTACDMTRTAAYVLGPQEIELQLTAVEPVKLPASEFYVVRVTLQPASAAAFANLTAKHVGRQLAFVRDGVVVSAPQISAPIDSRGLELSGDLSAQQADDMARMLRQPA
ncbi:MAG: hypothetical protein WAM92_16625 [Mycobacterium sp.]